MKNGVSESTQNNCKTDEQKTQNNQQVLDRLCFFFTPTILTSDQWCQPQVLKIRDIFKRKIICVQKQSLKNP